MTSNPDVRAPGHGHRPRPGHSQSQLPHRIRRPGSACPAPIRRTSHTQHLALLLPHQVTDPASAAYESDATTFPDGRVTTCRARQAPRGRGFWEKVAAGRPADVCFVLGELTGAHPAWPGAGLIDSSRMAMARRGTVRRPR